MLTFTKAIAPQLIVYRVANGLSISARETADMHQQSTIKFVPGRNPGNKATDSDDKMEFRTPAPFYRTQHYDDSGEITKTSFTAGTLSASAQDPDKQADYYAISP